MATTYLVFDNKDGGLAALFGAYLTLDLANGAAAEIKGFVVELPMLEDHRPEDRRWEVKNAQETNN